MKKPIATRLPDAEQMVKACDDTGALLVLNHQRRFNLNHRRLRELIAADGLGELTSASLQWGSGRLGNVGTHMIDALLMLTGRKIEAISATLDLAGKPDCRGPEFRDPGGWGIIKLEGGIMVTVDAGDYATVPGQIILNGAEGRAISDGSSITLEYWDGRQEHWDDANDGVTGMDRAVSEIVEWLDGGTEFRTLPLKLSIRWKPLLVFTLHTPTMRRGRNFRCRIQTVSAKSAVGNDARDILDAVIKEQNVSYPTLKGWGLLPAPRDLLGYALLSPSEQGFRGC